MGTRQGPLRPGSPRREECHRSLPVCCGRGEGVHVRPPRRACGHARGSLAMLSLPCCVATVALVYRNPPPPHLLFTFFTYESLSRRSSLRRVFNRRGLLPVFLRVHLLSDLV